jgi:hypothetical protein
VVPYQQQQVWVERSLGIVNKIDPLTQVPLEIRKPVALMVNEDTRELYGFDLYSLYHLCLKKNKLWVKTFR